MASAPRRPLHRQVVAILRQLDRAFLERCEAFFGGGTRIVLELGEYRESRDIDFLCASRVGYRLLRESVSGTSLGPVARKALALGREVRADQYGVRTWLVMKDVKLKFEIIREARISLEGAHVEGIPVSCLTRADCFAEKFLANADRGLDPSTLSRDAIDLAFMIEGWPAQDALRGYALATDAYGKDIARKLAGAVERLRTDRKYRTQCVEGLAITETKFLSRGLERLSRGMDLESARGARESAAKSSARAKARSR